MSKKYGCRNMYEPLRKVLGRRPDDTFAVDDIQRWRYSARPDLNIAQEEHDRLVDLLRNSGTEVVYHDEPLPNLADAIYVRDTSTITDAGAVILRMGKLLRRGEEQAVARCFEKLGVPILYRLHGEAQAEGGDLVWLDGNTLAVGQGFRTNSEGLQQLREAVGPLGVDVLPVELPYYRGRETCLHLMSFISPLDSNLAVVYLPLMPVSFWRVLKDRDFELVEVPEEEFLTMGPNVLAVAPRDCIMLEGNPVTKRRLEEAGCRVRTYRGKEISLKAEGGVTCLTRPLLRRE